MKKSFQKTLMSLTLIMALIVSGISYQANTAKAADDTPNVILSVGYDAPAKATANTTVEHSFSVEASEPISISCDVWALVNAKLAVSSVSTGQVLFEKDYPNTQALSPTDNGWFFDPDTQTYYIGISWAEPAAGEYKISITFDADTQYALLGLQQKASEPAENPYLTYSSFTVTKGFSQKLSVNDNTSAVTWKSSAPKVASVDKNGKVTGKKAGKATITASLANGKTLTCKVTVKDNAYTSTKLTAKKIPYGQAAMNIYKVSYSKGNIVIKARFLNNSTHKAKYLKNVKITIKNEKGKVIGTYKAKKVSANVKKGKVKDYTFKIKKSALKIKTTQDLRKIKTPSSSGKFVYDLRY